MKLLSASILILGVAGTASFAQESCSVERIQTQAPTVTSALQTIGARDADRLQELTTQIEQQMNALQTGTGDMNEVCALFDTVIAEAAG